MPFVRIDYIKNQYSEEELTKISRVLQSSLVDDFDVPEKDCFQVFQNHESFEFHYDPDYLCGTRTDRLLYIYITCGDGRSQAKKLKFYETLSLSLSRQCQVETENIFIILNESERENWSFGNGLAQAL
ncbi:tautomerase family protein [Lactococcus carnosus]|uniref:Tautomerase family protein n=1 Tax=Pseudolactococcus carnosus TaxID=2749961 RepID=A0ABT0AUF5_9LACT|nr:tautomerase family protein [Lactococcus carnosus]SCA92680.1 putative tautomerase [Lactococcus piscium]MCJ1969676.1 tautomerase family protein [Lactococcus carnosus]MCJ1973290.1 tautomerase family protein [Lactococcus carnosus]MCJ1975281.1 tautomerase family protein [Lactococcus carnosus]MCJ1978954.1 tautomerase family protein [Lactococcus carnosus]